MSGGAPLAGVRVLEVAEEIAASFCSRLLGDLGAEVTKLEPAPGDPIRSLGPFAGDELDPEGGALFHYLNAGKRACGIDPDDPEDAHRLEDMLATVDVLVEGVDVTSRNHWRLGHPDLRERHPTLLVVSVSPYGRTGVLADAPGTDLTASALSSLCDGLGAPGREPLRLPYDQASYQAGLHAAAATLCGLRERDRSGRGQAVDVAVAQVMAYCVGGMHLFRAKRAGGWHRGSGAGSFPYPTGLFECADGYVCILSQSPGQWGVFLRLMGEPEWARDEKARDSMFLGAHPELVDGHFRAWLKGLTRAEVARFGAEEGLTLGPAMAFDEILDDEHLAGRDAWGTVAVARSTVRVPNPGFTLTAWPVRVGGPGRSAARPSSCPSGSGVGAPGSGDVERLPPLEGVRILDFTWNWAGPMSTQLLADMGAEVIRVETGRRQDLMRFLPWTSWFFSHNNRSKRSVALDVGRPEGARLVHRLLPSVDVVVDNFRPGVMDRLDLGYESLRRTRPDVICVSMSVAGHSGPLRSMGGFASMGTAFAGLETLVGYEHEEPIGLINFGLGDLNLAINGAIGTLAALRHRDVTGEGQFVDVSMIESALSGLAEPILDYQLNGRLPGVQGNLHHAWFPHGTYACSGEERWVAVSVRNGSDWAGLCEAIGRTEWAADPSLATVPGRRRRRAEIDGAVASWCATQERDQAARRLLRAGVPAMPVLGIQERDGHEHFRARGLVLDHDSPGGEHSHVYATPWLFSDTPARVRCPAPVLGQDDDYVLRDLLGLAGDEIDRLVREEVVR